MDILQFSAAGGAMSRRRFEMFQYRQVIVRLRQGDTDREIARSRLMGRRKVTALRHLATGRGWLSPDAPLPDDETIAASLSPAKRAISTISTAEPFREQVERWVAQGVGGIAIHAALKREHGYVGSYSAVRRMVAGIRAALPPETTVRLSFSPGEAAQVDFGAGPFLTDPNGTRRRTWAFVMTLCFSRHQYLEFVFDQSVPTWLGCHRRAFEWFGSVPVRIIIDNAKCAITRACAKDPLVQRAYAECAEGYRFKIDACPPADPQKKGIVESGVKYVKGNFLPTRSFRDLADLNDQSRRWVMQEAGVRIHGTTRERPLAAFDLERPLLRPLPDTVPALGSWHRLILHRDCHIKFEYVLYSAPHTLVGQTLWMRATDQMVAIFQDYRLIASHLRSYRHGDRRTNPDHLPPDARAFFQRDRHWCLEQAQRIGPSCRALIEEVLTDRIVERLRSAQGILRFADTLGAERVEAACQRALAHGSPAYRTVKTILARGLDRLPLDGTQNSSGIYGQEARFLRDIRDLFNASFDSDSLTANTGDTQ
jgi:transposase